MTTAIVDVEVRSLVEKLRVLSTKRPRTVVGLCGPPGVGKSTLAADLADSLGPESATVVPMDGFHLSNGTLTTLGLDERKGAPLTFDVDGFAAVLARLADPVEPVVYVPEFRRDLDEPVAGAIAVHRRVPLVITEGNYLLSADPRWRRARSHLDLVWYLDVEESERNRRLVDRHQRFGLSRAEAISWVRLVDEENARLIAATADLADRRFRVIDLGNAANPRVEPPPPGDGG